MAEQKRVAIVTGQLVVGGAERQLYLWLLNMDRSRFSPVVITLHPNHNDYWESPLEALGVPLVRIPESTDKFSRLAKVFSAVKAFTPDLVQGWHLFASPYAGLVGKWLRKPSLGGFRDSYPIFKHQPLEGNLAVHLTDAMLINSETTARSLRAQYPHKADKIFAVQNAIVDDFIARGDARNHLRELFGLDDEKIWIGTIGRLDPKKRFDLYVQLASSLRDFPVQFLLIGDGPEKDKLERQATELGLGNRLIFTGEIPNAARWMKGLDIFSFTSYDEGMPNVVMEAGAAGLPVVTWDLPFYREILPSAQLACLVPPGDLEQMKFCLSNLINSPTEREKLGKAAQAHILQTFGLDRYVSRMTGLYDHLLEQSKKALS